MIKVDEPQRARQALEMNYDEEIRWRDQRIAKLEAENAELRARLDKLERFLGLNSSLAPSSDSEKDRKKRTRQLTGQRKQGAQPDHKGAKRELSFGSQSEQGLRLMERLWMVALTCKRQGASILDHITQAIAAHRPGLQPPQLV